MGFETDQSVLSICLQKPIWTISLWDLKRICVAPNIDPLNDLNYFPMGFETIFLQIQPNLSLDLNYFPMGFETSLYLHATLWWQTFELFPYGIWNNSYVLLLFQIMKFELFPYGIWNLQPSM